MTCLPLAAGTPLRITLAMHEYPPLAGQKLPHGGVLTQIVSESFAKSDVAVRVTWVPNNRAIVGVMEGLYDGSYGWAHTLERDAALAYSRNAICTLRMVFFCRRGEEHLWSTLEDLASCRIGTTMGNFYSDEFARLQSDGRLRVDEAPADAFNLKKLAAGRIDLFPMEQEAGQTLARTVLSPREQARITFDDHPISEVATYVVISRHRPNAEELAARFDDGFRVLTKSGRIQAILREARQGKPGAP
ncbi:MAG TPA: transporter substrate-binding domain-containing protein [Holophaga sp.]|nr:transporter substrate-binding domain-containing protein [Holophaga sp.]